MKKAQGLNEKDFLLLLQKILPKTTKDPRLADVIYDEVVREVKLRNNITSLEKFCKEGALPDLEPATITEFQNQLASNFGEENVQVVPDEKTQAVTVEVSLPDYEVKSVVRVAGPEDLEEEPTAPFVPFPVVLPEDPEMVWMLARRENFAAQEASRALSSIENEFWETKAGQKLLKELGERSFAEFISSVSASALADSSMKRLHKEPATLTTLHILPEAPPQKEA
jgi:hypothetical protein